MTKKKEYDVYTVSWSTMAIVLLLGFTILNFSADWIFRAQQIEINESELKLWGIQNEYNDNQNTINVLVGTVLEQLDKDVRSNMRVIDQLTGLLLRGEF